MQEGSLSLDKRSFVENSHHFFIVAAGRIHTRIVVLIRKICSLGVGHRDSQHFLPCSLEENA